MLEQDSAPRQQPGRLLFLGPRRQAAQRRAEDLALIERAGRIWRQMAEEKARKLRQEELVRGHECHFPAERNGAWVPPMTAKTSATSVGQRIVLMRERAGLSRRQLGKVSNVPERQLFSWEHDDHEPTARNLQRLIPHIGGTLDFYLEPDQGDD